jgi:hypothetical protein
MAFVIRDSNKIWYEPAAVKHHIDVNSALGFTELRQNAQTQRESNGGGFKATGWFILQNAPWSMRTHFSTMNCLF